MKVWFITGTSNGFGSLWAQAALERGDSVIATARDVRTLEPLEERFGDRVAALSLDVTDKTAVEACVAEARLRFGRLDVVVNNAGRGLFGTIEEVSEAQARSVLETNLFGALWVTQAVLPIFRTQRAGHLIQVSSIGGLVAYATTGIYHASKWGLEGFSEALAAEVAGFGIKVTIIEPGGYATKFVGTSSERAARLADYDAVYSKMAAYADKVVMADPRATVSAILKLVDSPDPPLRLFLGSAGLPLLQKEYARRLKTWEQWLDVSKEAQQLNLPANEP